MEYTAKYWDMVTPAPTGKYGKDIHLNSTTTQQRVEASKMLRYMEANTTGDYSQLSATTSPTPLLVQVPETNRVRLICGTAKYYSNIFNEAPSPLHNKLLAIEQDIDETNDPPTIIELPDDALQIIEMQVTSQEDFEEKVQANHDQANKGKKWYAEKDTGDTTTAPKAMPFPAYIAYDAFTKDIPAHEMWERVKLAIEPDWDDNTKHLFAKISDFLTSAHTKHKVSSPTSALPAATFTQRLHKDAKAWGKERKAKIFPALQLTIQTNAPPTTPTRASEVATIIAALKEAKVLSPTSVADTPAITDDSKDTIAKYGMCQLDLDNFLTMCGLNAGNEEALPEWVPKMATKGLSLDGKNREIRLACEHLIYEDHKIPLLPQVLKMFREKAFGGDDDGLTAISAMKGLSPYTMAPISDEEIEEDNDLFNAVSKASSTTHADLQKLMKRRAKTPTSFSSMITILRTYANLLFNIFGGPSPLLLDLKSDVIKGLALWSIQAKLVASPQTRASIMWTIYKQTKHFVQGKMAGTTTKYIPEWKSMILCIKTGQNLDLLSIPPGLQAQTSTPLPPTPRGPPLKRPIADVNSPQPGDIKGRDNQDTGPGGAKRIKRIIEQHKDIIKTLTPILPPRMGIKAICAICKTDPKALFPNTNLCIAGTLKGICTYQVCNKDHTTKITDAQAKHVISVLDPVVRDPKLLQNHGQLK